MICNICKKPQDKIIYNGKIRISSKSNSRKKYILVRCSDCELISFKSFLENENFFISGEYRKIFDKGLSISNFIKNHKKREFDKLNFYNLKKKNIHKKTIAELGCGAGILLDYFKNNGASNTIAVERAKFWKKHLEEKHLYYESVESLYNSGLKVDLVTSFAEVEHMQDPLKYCTFIYKTLNKNGKLLIRSPNYNNIYRYLLKNYYDLYDIRSSHYHYFNEISLKKLLMKSGFSSKNIKVDFFNEYNFDNLIKWLIHKKINKDNLPINFDKNFNESYLNFLRKNKLSNCLAFVATK